MLRILVYALAMLLSACGPSPAADHAFGDSVTRYIAATDAAHGWVSLLSTAMARAITNHGTDGDMVPDATPKVYGVSLAATDRATIMLGINDERIYCPSPCSTIDATKRGYYRRGYQALIAWLALGTKQTALTSGTYTGTWTSTAVYGIGKNSNVNGSTATYTVSGTVAYLGMIQQDGAPGTFDIKIDGTTVGSFSTQTTSLATVNGATYGAMLLRFPGLAAGSHTVQVIVTSPSVAANRVYIDWVSGSDQTIKPAVYVGNVLRAAVYSTGGSDACVAAYNSDVSALVSELAGDGLNVTLVNASGSINQTTDLDGAYHPVNAGHAKIEAAFYSAMTGPPPPPPTYSSAIIEMDVAGNFFGRLSTDTVGTTRKQIN